MMSYQTFMLILFAFFTVAVYESSTRKTISWSVAVYNKTVSSQCNLTSQIEQVQDKYYYPNNITQKKEYPPTGRILVDNMDALPCFFTCLIVFRVVHVIILHVFTFLVLCCDVRYNFRLKTMFGSSLQPICFVDSSFIFMLVACIIVYWCPTRFPYQMLFMHVQQ